MRPISRLCISIIAIFILIPSLGLAEEDLQPTQKETVYIIPIEGQISKAQVYILRRGLKQALAHKVKTVVLSINTPGGEVQTMLEMMEAINNFNEKIISFINKEAISAGAYIAGASDEIFFHPKGILGAAAVIQGTGADIPETMKQKLDSYLRARVRSYTQEYRYRSDVIRAMMDEDFEFKIGDEVLKKKGELLTLTAQEAVKTYGTPPEVLLGSGIVQNVDEILDKTLGKDHYQVIQFDLTWSEELARWLNTITPLLLGLGMLLLFIEFKTPGFGVFGIGGIFLLLVVFGSSYVAGLAGYEEILVFFIGILLLSLEILVFPGILFLGATGMLLIAGSIIWALADTWPSEDFKWSIDLFVGPLQDFLFGFILAVSGFLILSRYFLKGWIWNCMVLKKSEENVSIKNINKAQTLPSIGSTGICTTDLHPEGEVEVDGKRYQARVTLGSISKGTKIEILKIADFSLTVRKLEEK